MWEIFGWSMIAGGSAVIVFCVTYCIAAWREREARKQPRQQTTLQESDE